MATYVITHVFSASAIIAQCGCATHLEQFRATHTNRYDYDITSHSAIDHANDKFRLLTRTLDKRAYVCHKSVRSADTGGETTA